MTASPLDFTDAELDEARRMNRQLRWAPRFRAPSRVGKMMIQTMLGAQAFMHHGVAGVTTSMRRVTWQDHNFMLRILRPVGEVRGVYVDYHGGGWAIGTAAMDDKVNARIAAECGLVVVSVDYTTLPDIDLPGMIAQCAAAGDWAFAHAMQEFGATEMFIGGESAGAHLAACTMLRLRDTRSDFARLRGAVLFYGPYDLSCTPSVRSAPRDTLVLDGPAMTTGLARLLPDRNEEGRRDPAFSPLYADLAGLPPAVLLCGTIDPLIDDSTLMAERWTAASGNARVIIVPDAPHAFNRFPTRVASRTNAFVRDWIDTQLAGRADVARAAE
ncbi:MAG: alpha/beta hydrolase fold domain-containing protein [Hyphomonadaceae bacterium]|nr:alpha/beta hydrolase fold domain-containing protein [Hyphomonadaceae bacterium]